MYVGPASNYNSVNKVPLLCIFRNKARWSRQRVYPIYVLQSLCHSLKVKKKVLEGGQNKLSVIWCTYGVERRQ